MKRWPSERWQKSTGCSGTCMMLFQRLGESCGAGQNHRRSGWQLNQQAKHVIRERLSARCAIAALLIGRRLPQMVDYQS